MNDTECKYEPEPNPTKDDIKAQNREDFMKRWFAIALSVGFATALSRMPWVAERSEIAFNRSFDIDQVNQLLRLLAAGIATLLSWEGYLSSIRTKPLTDGKRFYIDVLLVTLYLVLLLTSWSTFFWIGLHALAFVIYVAWDCISIRAFPGEYNKNNFGGYPDRKSIYKGIFSGARDLYHGPTVTLIWPIYLISLAGPYYFLFSADQRSTFSITALYFVLVLTGLFGYRSEKVDAESSPSKRLTRVFVFAIFAILSAFLCWCIAD